MFAGFGFESVQAAFWVGIWLRSRFMACDFKYYYHICSKYNTICKCIIVYDSIS